MSRIQEFMRMLMISQMENADEASLPNGMNKKEFIESALQEMEDDSQQYIDSIWEHNIEMSGAFHAGHGVFITENEEPLWHEALAATEAFYLLIVTFVERYREEMSMDEDFEEGPTDIALDYMHMRMCQHCIGVLVSLRHGFAENALTLWHKMYELLCSAYFINTSNQPEKLAEAYLKYTHTEDGSHIWAKFDKRLSAVKGSAIPFARIESVCGLDNTWPRQERYTYSHFDITKDRAKNIAGIMPDVSIGGDTAFLMIPALQSAKTLALLTELLFVESLREDYILFLRSLEIFQEKLDALYKTAFEAEEDDDDFLFEE